MSPHKPKRNALHPQPEPAGGESVLDAAPSMDLVAGVAMRVCSPKGADAHTAVRPLSTPFRPAPPSRTISNEHGRPVVSSQHALDGSTS
jgi:hypothetical protein